jgi:hypothetical protein
MRARYLHFTSWCKSHNSGWSYNQFQDIGDIRHEAATSICLPQLVVYSLRWKSLAVCWTEWGQSETITGDCNRILSREWMEFSLQITVDSHPLYEEWFGWRIKGLWCMAVNSTGVCIIHNPGMAHHLLEGQSLWWVFYQELHSTYACETQLSSHFLMFWVRPRPKQNR